MKGSVYNIELFESNEETFVYNSLTGAVSGFNKRALSLLDEINTLNIKSLTPEEKTYLALMKDNGFIVEDDFNEKNWVLMQNKSLRFGLQSTSFRITIAPTMLCNYNCYYCYESKAEKNARMSDEIIYGLVDYVEKQILPGLEEIYVSWYGGEPLLAIDVIETISDRLIKICKKHKIAYKSDILSNGYLLSKKTANMLVKKCKVSSVQIPLDGMEKTYCQRKDVDKEMFQTVINNICDIKDLMNVHIRLNVDKDNKDEIIELAKYLLVDRNCMDKVRMYVAPVKNYSNVCSFIDNGCFSTDDVFEYKKFFIDKLSDLGERYSILSSIRVPSYMSCGLSRVKNIIVDPKGNLYRCAHLIGHQEQSVGNVFCGQIFNEPNMEYLNMNFEEKCLNCKLFPLCMGGCYFEKKLNSGTSVCRESIERLRHSIKVAINNNLL